VANSGCNRLVAAVDMEHSLYWADVVLTVLGCVVALVVGFGWYRRSQRDALSPAGIDSPADIEDGSAPRTHRLIPPEAVLLPVLAYLTVLLIAYPVLRHFSGRPAGDAEETGLAFDAAQLVSNNFAFIVAGGLCVALGGRFLATGGRAFVFGEGPFAGNVLRGGLGALAAIGLCQLVLAATLWLITWLRPDYVFPDHNVIVALRDPACPAWLPIVLWVGVTTITPFAEEAFFRGILQSALVSRLRSPGMGIAIAAGVFGLAHGSQPQVVPALTLFGVILGLLHRRTGSLIAPIVAHGLFNAKTLLWETLRLTAG
jgi:membrane protease YdiL (CAAX protease family)